MSGASIAAEVAAAIGDAASEVGNGSPLPVSLWRVPADAEATYPPAAMVRTEFVGTALIMKDGQRTAGDGITRSGDVEIMLAAEAEFVTEPEIGDRLDVTSDHFPTGSRVFTVNGVDAMDYGGVSLMWNVQAVERGQE